MVRLVLATLIVAVLIASHSSIGQARGLNRLPLVVLLATDQPSYLVGSTATFTLAVDNPGATPVGATFPSAQIYDIVVYKGESEVWRWSSGRGFATVIVDRSFAPGLTLLGRESWDWRDNAGTLLEPGAYTVVASLTTLERQPGNVVELRLQAPS